MNRLLRHSRVIGEIALLESFFSRIGTEKNDIERFNPIASELPLGFVDIRDSDLLAGCLVSQIENYTVAIAVFNRDSLGARGIRLDMTPRIDVGSDMVAGNDHAVIRDLIDAILVRPYAHRHLAMSFHLYDSGLGDV